MKQRDYLFDNYKALLIFLVVLGHFVEMASEENLFLHSVRWLIFSFHMPAFIFISGYFSKKKPEIRSLFQKLVMPYLIFEVLYYLLYTFVIHKETQLWLLYPKFTLWYLMALFVWKLVTPLVVKIPGHLMLSVALGLWVGASGLDDNFLTLPRMIVFYPFFLLGVDTKREMIMRFRKKIPKKAAWAILGVLAVVIIGTGAFSGISPKIFYGRYDYAYMGQSTAEGIGVRLLCYGISLAVTLMVLCVMTEREGKFSYLGSRTMAIYLFHGLVCSVMKAGWHYLGSLNVITETLILILGSIAVTEVLSLKPFTELLNKITGVKA